MKLRTCMARHGDENFNLSTPVQGGLCVPSGHAMVHVRWRGYDFMKYVQNKISVLYFDNNESVTDFHPSSQVVILYLTESDLCAGVARCRRRVAKLRRSSGFSGHHVFFDKTTMTEHLFNDFQKFIVIECGSTVFPLASQQEAGDILVKMVRQETRTPKNPFKSRAVALPTQDSLIISCIKSFPNVGETKAKHLLNKFQSIRAITEASVSELAAVIGLSAAKNLKSWIEP